MFALNWVREPMLDTWEAVTDRGTYLCTRTAFDVAKLWFNGELIRSSSSDGCHSINKAFAEEHYKCLR